MPPNGQPTGAAAHGLEPRIPPSHTLMAIKQNDPDIECIEDVR
jgi:hypothetical protein